MADKLDKVWLNENDYKSILPKTRHAGLYEVYRGRTYWHRKANGMVLGPRVMRREMLDK